MNSFTLYDFTFFICTIFWIYFDTLSNIAIKYQLIHIEKESEDKTERHNLMGKDKYRNFSILTHIAIKSIFYVSGITFLFLSDFNLLVLAFIAFFIGTLIANKSKYCEELVYRNNEDEFKKSLIYFNISFLSFFVFVLFLILI